MRTMSFQPGCAPRTCTSPLPRGCTHPIIFVGVSRSLHQPLTTHTEAGMTTFSTGGAPFSPSKPWGFMCPPPVLQLLSRRPRPTPAAPVLPSSRPLHRHSPLRSPDGSDHGRPHRLGHRLHGPQHRQHRKHPAPVGTVTACQQQRPEPTLRQHPEPKSPPNGVKVIFIDGSPRPRRMSLTPATAGALLGLLGSPHPLWTPLTNAIHGAQQSPLKRLRRPAWTVMTPAVNVGLGIFAAGSPAQLARL